MQMYVVVVCMKIGWMKSNFHKYHYVFVDKIINNQETQVRLSHDATLEIIQEVMFSINF